MNTELTIVSTADGSNTIWNPAVGENYHSRHGAVQESRHVFIQSGLQYFLANNLVNKVSILEVGFGTGLNFILTADYCSNQNITLSYTGIEAYPLTLNMIKNTRYDKYCTGNLWEGFTTAYEQALLNKVCLAPNCHLQIAPSKLQEYYSEDKYDVIYFDAFAAIHQPDMWNEASIAHTLQFLNTGGVFVTYAITGNLKRMIKSLGLKVEKAPGAPGKREMLRAIKT